MQDSDKEENTEETKYRTEELRLKITNSILNEVKLCKSKEEELRVATTYVCVFSEIIIRIMTTFPDRVRNNFVESFMYDISAIDK